MKFVDQIAEFVKEKDYSLNDLVIVLPSERMKKYLQIALVKAYGKPILSPKIVTIDQWVKSHSNRVVIDRTRVLLELFQIQLKDAKTEEDRSFDEFLTWGEILISDFNEIDRYLVDAKQIFRNLADIKEIENWSFGNETLSDAQKRFMEFWDRLPGYYHELNKRLDDKGQCYGGSAYRWFTEHVTELCNDKKFIFAGFNALSASEMSLVKQLHRMGRAEFFIDADTYYLDNKRHEAGSFLRNTLKELEINMPEFTRKELETKELDVTVVECAQNTGQVKVMSTLLDKMNPDEIDNTLLLLADESLINSVVRNLPVSIKKANITLGMPIRNSSVRTWVDLLFSIQENKKRFRTTAMYFADLQKLWNHPFVLSLMDDQEQKLIAEADERIIRGNRIFVNPDNLEVGPVMRMVLDKVVKDWSGNWKDAVEIIRDLNRSVYAGLDKEYSFEKAILECFDKALVDFENIVTEGIPEMSLRSFRHLFNQSWYSKSIAYHGNPVNGLQIMGLLETRGIDFERIICLGMNEGNLPPTNPIQTLIPMDLRKFHQLPTPRDKQGIFAHHFYRLLHHAKDIWMTYSTADEGIGFTEASRYILQLEKELDRSNTKVNLKRKVYGLELSAKKMINQITKTDEIVNRLDVLFEKSTSASMIKKYTTCPLDFYYRYVMDFGEEEAVEEEIEYSTFGTFIHNTLEELYLPFARIDADGNERSPAPRNIKSTDVEKMLKEFEVVLDQQFLSHFNNDRDAFMKGKNYLSYQMAKDLTARFLKSEIEFLSRQTEPVFIEALEQEYEEVVEIEVNGNKKKVKLRGFVDRIDRVGEQFRIIDYKSGKVEKGDVEFSSRGTEEQVIDGGLRNRKHLLQLVQYAYLFKKKHKKTPSSSIISFVSNNQQPLILKSSKYDLDEIIDNYPEHLGNILSEVYDTDIPFEHQSKGQFSYCKYCE
jgi:CRISPR/Cas system-associated exonuclease Cas4 (RecB family)